MRIDTIDYPRIAWTGGDVPRRGICLADSPFGRRYRRVRSYYFQEQLVTWIQYWKDLPNKDTRKIFWNRASLDSWATVRHLA